MVERKATHAGSWYSADAKKLERELSKWFNNVNLSSSKDSSYDYLNLQLIPKAIIAPHAGYKYCGQTAAFAYKAMQPSQPKRIFILGPSHHVSLRGCALSSMSEYQTPLGNIKIDGELTRELLQTGRFTQMSREVDEEEHSLEMQLPFIFHVMNGKQFQIIPILVGSLDEELEKEYSQILYKYFIEGESFFIVSSDFCHWGTRFSYTYRNKNLEINESIRLLDEEAMSIIKSLKPEK
ncbi:protein MEMO1 homolog isoform X2 [Zophobas morio]